MTSSHNADWPTCVPSTTRDVDQYQNIGYPDEKKSKTSILDDGDEDDDNGVDDDLICYLVWTVLQMKHESSQQSSFNVVCCGPAPRLMRCCLTNWAALSLIVAELQQLAVNSGLKCHEGAEWVLVH